MSRLNNTKKYSRVQKWAIFKISTAKMVPPMPLVLSSGEGSPKTKSIFSARIVKTSKLSDAEGVIQRVSKVFWPKFSASWGQDGLMIRLHVMKNLGRHTGGAGLSMVPSLKTGTNIIYGQPQWTFFTGMLMAIPPRESRALLWRAHRSHPIRNDKRESHFRSASKSFHWLKVSFVSLDLHSYIHWI